MSTVGSGWMLLLPLLVALTPSATAEPAPAVSTAPAAADACTLTMGWDLREPYHFEDADGGVRGLDVELVTAIAEGAGCTLTFERGEWSVLFDKLKRGSVDLLAGATATTEHEAFARYSAGYREGSFRLYNRAGEGEFLTGDSFYGVLENGPRIGLVEDYFYGSDLRDQQIGGEFADFFVEGADAHANLLALVEMGVDVVLEDPLVASALLSRHGWQDRVELHPLDLGTKQVSLMLSRISVDEALVQRLNQSIETLKASGAIDAIVKRAKGEQGK